MRRKMIAALMSAACILAAVPSTAVFADGQKVVTLGADLSEEQKQAILRYFGVAGQNLQTLTITNQDERNHLGSYVPIEQIGTRTYSCALVSPTNTGGIQVKTANLSWVTSNMIAATLSTSGVVNCDVLAASPFEVSGTGALTGILMAYESAVGEVLDETKKEVATQELITTTTIANNIGPIEATEIVNETKTQIIEGNVVSGNDIDVIITEVAQEQNISLSEDDKKLLADLMQQIAEQEYDYEEMKETLDRIESNMEDLQAETETQITDDVTVIETAPSEAPAEQTETPETIDPNSILMNTDDSALGDSVIFDATDDSTLTETEAPATETPAQSEQTGDFDITTSDSYGDDTAQSETAGTDGSAEVPEQTEAPAGSETGAEQTEAPAGSETGAEQTEAPAGSEADAAAAEIPADVPASSEEGILDGGADIMIEAETGDGTAAVITADDMEFAPQTSEENSYAVYPAGVNELTVYFKKSDITAGTGSLTVCNAADGSVVEVIGTSDAAFEAMTDEELLEKGWEQGTKATVYLSEPLAQNTGYCVTMQPDAFMTADGTAHSEEITDASAWVIQTSEYGFSIDKAQPEGIKAGSTVSGSIMMDGTAATYAAIENADPAMVTFDMGEFTASGTFHATFGAAGETSFQVCFYDAAGTLLNTIDYTVTVK